MSVAAEMFGRYRLDALLGRGGMGEVYRAWDTAKGRHVAVKRLRRDLAADESFQRLFRNEAERTARLADPHVIPIHDYGEINGQLFLEMRLVDGLDLASHLQRLGPMPPGLAVTIISQVASALDSAHAAGLVHRDVKPSNVLVTGIGRAHSVPFAYLVDFGIARLLPEAGGTAATQRGGILGTLAYMAPERFEGDASTTGGGPALGRPSIDVYALACMLYECLTAKKPFTGEAVTLMMSHLQAPPPRPSEVRAGLPSGLDEVVAVGMAKDPLARYPTAGALAAAARVAAGEEARPPLPGPRSYSTTAPIEPMTVPPTTAPTGTAPAAAPPRHSRRRFLIGAGVAAGLAGAGVAGWRFLGPSGGGQVRWSAPTAGQIVSTPRPAGTTVYGASNDGALYAFDAADGSTRWRFPTGAALGSTPEVLGGVVYLGSDDGFLYAVDAITGTTRWKAELGGIVHSPRAAGGVVYVGCADAKLRALDVTDGRVRWTFTGGNDMHQAVLSGDTVLIGSSDTALYAVNANDGTQRWRFFTKGAVSGASAVTASAVLTGSTDQMLYALAPGDGSSLWQADGVASAAVPVVRDNTVYVATSDNGIVALDLATGARRWRFGAGGDVRTPVVSGDTLYAGSADNRIYALDAATGAERWSVTVGGGVFAAALSDGVVYAGASDNRLYAVTA